MSEKNDKTAQPMDAGAEEISTPVMASNRQRTAYGVKTLINEVVALFPETPYEVSGYDGRNTGLDVMFDSTTLDDETKEQFTDLLSLVKSDIRVRSVLSEEGGVLVEFHRSPRVQDSRDSFNLADAWMVLSESEEPEGMSMFDVVVPENLTFEDADASAGWPEDVTFGNPQFDGGSASETSDDETEGGGA